MHQWVTRLNKDDTHRAVIYTRPTQGTPEPTLVATSQLRLCREFAQKRGYHVAAEFEDDQAAPYFEDARPVLWQAIEALTPGDVLLVAEFHQLARSLYVSDIIEEAVGAKGATIVSAAGEPDWPDSDERRPLRAAFRQRASWNRSAQESRRHSRRHRVPAPFGHARDPASPDQLVPVEGEQQAIALVASLYGQGMSLREIARRLDETGIPCRGRRWHHMTVQRILARAGALHGSTQASAAK